MILLIISYLLLLYVEIFGEVLLGDKHDFNSKLRLVATLLLASAMGLLVGVWYGVGIYLGIRLVLFDISFGYLFKGDMWYLGTTSQWDINKRKLIDTMKNIFKTIKSYFDNSFFGNWYIQWLVWMGVGTTMLYFFPNWLAYVVGVAVAIGSIYLMVHYSKPRKSK